MVQADEGGSKGAVYTFQVVPLSRVYLILASDSVFEITYWLPLNVIVGVAQLYGDALNFHVVDPADLV